MSIKFVHYVGMTFVACEMPQDKPIMCGVVAQNGELRAFWRDPENRGDDKMMLNFNAEIGKAMITGEIPMPIFAFIHPNNEPSNKFVAKSGFQAQKVMQDGTEWNVWFMNDELMKIIMDSRKRYLSVSSDADRQSILNAFANDFEVIVRNKAKLGEAVKAK